MPAFNDDLATLDAQIDQIKLELASLNDSFAGNLKALGLTEDDLKKLDLDSQPDEIKKGLQRARQAAAKEGSDRAQAVKSQAAPATPPLTRRSGAVKV
jgi:hypothetical protein